MLFFSFLLFIIPHIYKQTRTVKICDSVLITKILNFFVYLPCFVCVCTVCPAVHTGKLDVNQFYNITHNTYLYLFIIKLLFLLFLFYILFIFYILSKTKLKIIQIWIYRFIEYIIAKGSGLMLIEINTECILLYLINLMEFENYLILSI